MAYMAGKPCNQGCLRTVRRETRGDEAGPPSAADVRGAQPGPLAKGAVAPEGGPLFACCNVGPKVVQFTFTWMLFGFASGFFGRWMTSTPCFDSARILSASMVAGSEKARVKVP